MKHAYYGNLALAAIVCFCVTVRASPTVTSNFCYEVLTYTAISEESYTPSVTETVDMLLVGGGGGGGGGNTIGGGGGGGGGVLYVTGVTLTNGVEYKIVVGQGGANGTDLAANGGDSFVATYEEGGVVTNDVCRAYGGGGGGGTVAGAVGASGGGGGPNKAGGVALLLDPMQGCDAASSTSGLDGSGGGGATKKGGEGVNATSFRDGGDGFDCDISGTWHCYGSGGGEGSSDARRPLYGVGGKESGGTGFISSNGGTRERVLAVSGANGFGGGGGGGGYDSTYSKAGRGGSGTVIIRRSAIAITEAPQLGRVSTNDVQRDSAAFSVEVWTLGDGAASATVSLSYGTSPDFLNATASLGTITNAGTYAVQAALQADTAYYGKFAIVNDQGRSAETAVFSFFSNAHYFRATGGDLQYDDGDDRVLVFTNTVASLFLDVTRGGLADVLVVGGGGAGGGSMTAGGGGGGGVLYATNHLIPRGQWAVTVGTGGVETARSHGLNGGDSILYDLHAFGGGGGGQTGAGGYDGGSGGGGGVNDPGIRSKCVAGQGMEGGHSRGGGGGATQKGGLLHTWYVTNIVEESGTTTTNVTAYANTGGDGGNGLDCDITGEQHCYGSGGGAGMNSNLPLNPQGQGGRESGGMGAAANSTDKQWHGNPGVDALGGGGGGASHYNNNFGYGGKGGSGLVVVRYKIGCEGFRLILR